MSAHRRDEIAAAVAAYNQAHPFSPLPSNAVRLLTVMFPSGDVCRRRLGDIAADATVSRDHLPETLRWLTSAGFLSRQRGSGVASAYRLHLPPLVRG